MPPEVNQEIHIVLFSDPQSPMNTLMPAEIADFIASEPHTVIPPDEPTYHFSFHDGGQEIGYTVSQQEGLAVLRRDTPIFSPSEEARRTTRRGYREQVLSPGQSAYLISDRFRRQPLWPEYISGIVFIPGQNGRMTLPALNYRDFFVMN